MMCVSVRVSVSEQECKPFFAVQFMAATGNCMAAADFK